MQTKVEGREVAGRSISKRLKRLGAKGTCNANIIGFMKKVLDGSG